MRITAPFKRPRLGKRCGPTGKRIFKSEHAANMCAERYFQQWRTYTCEFCGFTHITKKV